jgi:hypothetical protein
MQMIWKDYKQYLESVSYSGHPDDIKRLCLQLHRAFRNSWWSLSVKLILKLQFISLSFGTSHYFHFCVVSKYRVESFSEKLISEYPQRSGNAVQTSLRLS